MKKYLGFVLASALVVTGASFAGCGDDSSGTGATGGGTGGTGGGTGGTGGGGTVDNPCQDAGGSGDIDITAEEITADQVWEAACNFFLTRETYVTNGAELTIEAGTEIQGDPMSALIITSDGTINAVGTATDPIVFTSSALPSQAQPGDWGGVVLLGTARLSWGDTPCNGELGECVGSIEGISPDNPRGAFGGNDDTHDCGTMNYVRIEYAGSVFGDDNELNSLTVGGCGDQTELSYIQTHRGLDDGVEFFGGTASIDHVIVSGTGDDGLDWDQGWRGNADFLIVHHFASTTSSPNGIEADNFGSGNNNVEPRSAPNVTNATIIGDGRPEGSGVVTRVGTWGVLTGFVVVDFGGAGYDMRNGAWSVAGGWPVGIVVNDSCFDGNGTDWPVDTNADPLCDPVITDCNDEEDDEAEPGSEPYFAENVLLAEGARNNSITDPGLGDFSTAATGGDPAPDYSISNDDCAGGLGGVDGENWIAGWTAFPVGAADE
ncbi:MAG: hypothetical protein AAF500_18100 [Myxococcota bacterium]